MQGIWKTVFSNSFLLLSVRVVSKVATIIVMVLAARHLGIDQFGLFSAILAATSLSGILSDFGLVLPTIRSVSKGVDGERAIVGETFSARLFWGSIAFAGVLGFSFLAGFPAAAAILFALSSIFETCWTALIRAFEGRLEMKIVTVFTLLERVIFSVSVVGALLLAGTLVSVSIGYLVSSVLMLVVSLFIFQKRFGDLQIRLSWKQIVEQSAMGLPFFITAGFSAFYYKADTILLGLMRGNAEAGIYNAAMRVIDAQMFIPMAVMATIFPSLSRLFHEKDTRFLSLFKNSFFFFLVSGAIVTGLIYFFSPALINVLFPPAYRDSITCLQYLSLLLVFYFLNFLLSQTLIAMHLERLYTAIIVLCASMSFMVNLFIIPAYGYNGAAGMRVGMECIMSVSFVAVFIVNIRKQNLAGKARVASGTGRSFAVSSEER